MQELLQRINVLHVAHHMCTNQQQTQAHVIIAEVHTQQEHLVQQQEIIMQ